MLWTEDWFDDHDTHRWSYFASRMRSAIALADYHHHQDPLYHHQEPHQDPHHPHPMEFSGYVAVKSSGSIAGAMVCQSYLPTYLLIYLRTYLPIYPPIYLPIYPLIKYRRRHGPVPVDT